MTIYGIQVNHLENPLGFRMEHVRFSWKVKDAVGAKQESARVKIAADAAMEQLLADTGFDPQADSLCFPVALELQPRTRYYYTVTVRTDAGEEQESEQYWFETGMQDAPWQAKWITCDNTEKRHPWFEKEITPAGEVASARLYICGLGLYEAYFNGQRIGQEYLTPYSNNYNQWVQYQTYDVTQQLQTAGTLSVLLGNGWYKSRFGFTAWEDTGFYGNEWKLIAQLHLRYADGREEVVCTDESWTVRRSNITFSNLYDGEHRDDTLAPLPQEHARFCEAPKGKLTDRMSTPVTVHEVFTPKELIVTPKKELVLDMGQEFTGSFRLKVDVPAGTVVHIQTGEILQQGCFYNENLRSAKSEYFYTSNGESIILQPHCTFYGYRYVKIEGIPNLKKEDFEGLAFYSHIPDRGRMTTGHELVNQLLSNIRWGLKGNFVDVPTDCPQRDERMGWTGDAQVFSPTATYLQDTYSFYAKYLYDMYQEQLALGGKVPDVVPSCGVESCACVWGDAACIIPWNVYRFYGDKQILADQFASMKAWVDYITQVDGDNHGWRYVFHYGDWLALDNMEGNPEEVMGATDEEFIANVYYAASAELVSKAAHVLGYREEEAKYAALAKEQFDIVKKEYFSATGRCCIKTQTALLLALKYDLTENRELTVSQLSKLFRKSGEKLKTGFVGTPLLCKVLSDNGMEDLAFKLLLNEDYPGWLREVKLGATTVWERWNSLLDDGTISGVGMNSMNHYAYGSVAEWMFAYVAGLQLREDVPGGRHMHIQPRLNWKLRKQETVYDSPGGEYRSAWEILDLTHVKISVTVPFGCSARLWLPRAKEETVLDLGPGTFTTEYETDGPLKKIYNTHIRISELMGVPEIKRLIPQLAGVPVQYVDYSPREMIKLISGIVTEEDLDRWDALLAQME